MSWKRTGFLCEYDSKHVSVFDCKQRKLYKMLNTYGLEKLEIGKCYDLKHMSIQETSVDEKFHNLVVFRVDSGCVLADTIATIADEKDLKKNENFEKFRGKVWSQYLGFLRDPKNLFAENMKGGELGWVTVKYAPDEDTVFEINDVAENYLVQLPAEQLLPTPWSPNYPTVERPQRRLHPSQRVFDNKFAPLQPCFRLVKYGVCVQTDVLNPLYCRRKPGSMKHCHHLFAMTLGMYRCMHRVELGCWYQHEVRDSRRDQKKYSEKRNAKQFDSLTATKLFKIDPPLPTTVVNGKVEFEVEFPFDHDVLEKEGNRAIPDWFPRFEGLQKDAHFWNEYLGKVEIYPRQAREIIQIVEAWPLETIPDVFTVVATVALHYNAATNNETYPENGIFLVTNVKELGCWYQHEVRDSRRDQKKYSEKRNAKQFDSLTATKLFKIDPPLPTTVVNGKVEFEVEFPFDHDVLEKEGNRAIPDWFPRFEGLQKDAHFWNEYLGKVEIYPRQAREIIQIVEAWPLETIPDVFTVVATVALHYNAATNNETYPENGIFLVTNVKEVKGAN